MPDYSSLRRGLQHYWSMDNGSYPYTQWDRMRSANLSVFTIPPTGGMRKTGKIGYGANLSASVLGASIAASSIFGTAPSTMTISIWFKMDTPTGNPYPVRSTFGSPLTGEYHLQYLSGTSQFQFSFVNVHPLPIPSTAVTVEVSHVAVAGEWIHALLFLDVTGQKIGLRVNNGTTAWTYSPIITAYAPGYSFQLGPSFSGVIDDTAIWSRLLTDDEQSWLYNDDTGLGYDSFAVVADTANCQEIPCCEEDPYTYQASSATASGSATGSDCAEVPMVTIEPPQSSSVSFPTFVILSASLGGSVMHYTTDGSEPDEDSTIYTIPFQIFGPGEIVKAKAWLGDCVGPTVAVAYQRADPEFTFRLVCPTSPVQDRSGIWGVWALDGHPDYQWQITTTLAAALHVVAFEIYETNSVGEWNTGQAWATREYVDPPNGTFDFHVYPLVLDEGGQINAAYADDFSTTFGDFGIGAHTIDLYGNIQIDVPGVTYFRLRMFLEDGTVMERIIASDVCTPPPCEEHPPTPTVTAQCGTLTVAFTTTAALPYYITRTGSDSGTEITVKSGTTTAGPDTFIDGGLMPNVTYCYRIWVQYAGCPEYTSSDPACGTILTGPGLTVTQDVTLIEGASGTVTFTIVSSGVDPLGVCGSNEVEYSYTDGTGLHTGSVLANVTQVRAIAITRPAVPGPYVATFVFSACNDCATETRTLTVHFAAPPCCTPPTDCPNADNPLCIAKLADLTDFTDAVKASTCAGICNYTLRASAFPPVWSGEIPYGSSCRWIEQSGTLALCNYTCVVQGEVVLGYLWAVIQFIGTCNDPGAYWTLGIALQRAGLEDLVLWNGTKTNGDSPSGTYTQQLVDPGCVTLATIQVT